MSVDHQLIGIASVAAAILISSWLPLPVLLITDSMLITRWLNSDASCMDTVQWTQCLSRVAKLVTSIISSCQLSHDFTQKKIVTPDHYDHWHLFPPVNIMTFLTIENSNPSNQNKKARKSDMGVGNFAILLTLTESLRGFNGVVDSAKLPLLIAIICPGFCAAIIRKSIREFQILLKVEERGDYCIL